MNKIYRKVWSAKHGAFVAAAETTRSRTKTTGGVAGALLASVLLAGGAQAQSIPTNTLPSGAQVTAGAAAISSIGNTMTVQQSTQRAAIDWQRFSVGRDATVNFVQPNSSAVVLNRVVGNERSVIDGAINANGQVWILNSSGLLFNGTAQVNVGGLVASTLDISNADFMAGRNTFTSNGSRASVINLGTINAADGGYVALLGNQVSNQGVISARLGTAALAAGDRISLNFNGDSLVGVAIDQGTLNALVENKNAIIADGGQVVLTAKGLDTVLGSLVNNTGEIHARTIGSSEGKIYLLADMEHGTVKVDGLLDASAPNGGHGGFIETSAANVSVADSARVTTLANVPGQTGEWLIDPNDFVVAASGGNISGAALSFALGTSNQTILTTSSGTGGTGDITINDNVTWTSGNRLTINAQRNVNINATLDASGGLGGSVNLYYGQDSVAAGNTASYNFGLTSSGFTGKINLQAGPNFKTKQGSDGTLTNWTVITQLGSQGDETANPGNSLQGLANSANFTGNFVLGADINAAATSTWNSTTGFVPISGSISGARFNGMFDGLGHTIDQLTIHNPVASVGYYVGLFGRTGSSFLARNIGLTNIDISTNYNGGGGSVTTGALVGYLGSSGAQTGIFSSYSSGSIAAVDGDYSGGLIGQGWNACTVDHSFSSVNVTETGSGTSGSSIGGLIGDFRAGTLTDSFAVGTVSSTGNNYSLYIGGLVGSTYASILRSYATGSVSAAGGYNNRLGGLVGYTNEATITQSYATGAVSALAGGGNSVGGLVGQNSGAASIVTQSYSSGSTFADGGSNYVGGLVGRNTDGATIDQSFATGQVSVGAGSSADKIGGLVGYNSPLQSLFGGQVIIPASTITNSFWDTTTTGQNAGWSASSDTGHINAATQGYATAAMQSHTTYAPWGVNLVTDPSVPAGNYPTLRWTTSTTAPGSSAWIMNGPQMTAVNFTLSNITSGYTYNGTPYSLDSLWSTASIFSGCGGCTSWVAGTDYAFLYNGQTVTGFRNAGTYSNIGIRILASGYLPASSGNTLGLFTIDPLALTLTGATANNKIYNGTVAASLSGGTLVGVVTGDAVTATTGTFADKNVGTNKVVTALLAGVDAGNYTLTQPSGLTADITPKTLTISGTTVVSTKVYDGTTAATLTGGALSGVVSGDAVTLTQAGTFADKNAGTGKSVTAGDTISGGDASNYTLTQPSATLTGSITPKTLTVGGTTVTNKVYDGTTNATLSGGSLVGVVNGDTVTLTELGHFADKNVGTAKAVTAADVLAGADAANYSLTQPNGALSGDITPKTLGLSGNKVYDGTTALTGPQIAFTGLVNGETLTYTNATAHSKDPGAGNYVDAVTLADGTNGGLASNYQLPALNPNNAPVTIDPASNPAVNNAVATAINTPKTVAPPVSQLGNGGTRGDTRNFTNVAEVPPSLGNSFGPDAILAVISAPSGDEPNQVVSLSDAKKMLRASKTNPASGAGDSNGRDVRVPVSRNSLAEIVNGGVRLPSGVEQQLFVVKGN